MPITSITVTRAPTGCQPAATSRTVSAEASYVEFRPRVIAPATPFLAQLPGLRQPGRAVRFIGIEERGVGTADTLWRELLVRANHFEPIEDLKRAQEHPAFESDFTVAQQLTTWVMSKIVLLMDGDPRWQREAI